MNRINNCVEKLKLTYLSGTPIAWIVVKEKEIADKIATAFMNDHLGDRQQTIGCSYALNDIYDYAYRETICSTEIPSIFFNWINGFEESINDSQNITKVKRLLERHIDFKYRIESQHDTRANVEEDAKDARPRDRDFAIIASPYLPDLGWLNTYTEVIYLSCLSDDEIKDIIKGFATTQNIEFPETFITLLVENFRGVNECQIKSVLMKCLVSEFFDNGENDKVLKEIRRVKRQMLDGFNGLKWIVVDDNGQKAAGLDSITEWLTDRKPIFSETVNMLKKGYDLPKGLLITGIPGTGKSLMAKEAARTLSIPLISMDLGDIQEGIVGKSEEHMAEALRMVDAMAPCVLWIDEIEKAFSGASSSHSDGGVMQRMFGKFLTWMQEKDSVCFVLATSNDITNLPPELFRSERFDEKFYTFMPTAEECADIFVANIKTHNERLSSSDDEMPQKIFDSSIFEKKDYWLDFLNNICSNNISPTGVLKEEAVELDKSTGRWLKGYLPEKKLFTGADISAFVKILKFKILIGRKNNGAKNYGFSGAITKSEADNYLLPVLGSFMPYGQTNLNDIAKCFLKLAKNRFKPASSASEEYALIRFSDFDESNNTIKYDPNRFNGSSNRYNSTLYRCIVGAINGLNTNNSPTNNGNQTTTKPC